MNEERLDLLDRLKSDEKRAEFLNSTILNKTLDVIRDASYCGMDLSSYAAEHLVDRDRKYVAFEQDIIMYQTRVGSLTQWFNRHLCNRGKSSLLAFKIELDDKEFSFDIDEDANVYSNKFKSKLIRLKEHVLNMQAIFKIQNM